MPISIDLTNKNALVTGGTRGIGAVISKRLVVAGARVGMLYRSDEESANATLKALNAGSNKTHFTVQADLTDEASTQKTVESALEKFGGALDIIVLNAAQIRGGGNIADMAIADWQFALDANLLGNVAVLKACHSAMRRGGSVVAISSGAGHDPLAGMAAYGASKAALNQMITVLAQEWGPDGIRANIVSPGSTAKTPVDYDHLSDSQKTNIAATALRRIGTADDVADVVLFFASELSSFVTGQWIRVNGGRV